MLNLTCVRNYVNQFRDYPLCWFLLPLWILGLLGCESTVSVKPIDHQGKTMGTTYSVKANGVEEIGRAHV